MVFHPNPPSERPALIEALAVWGWAVAHGGIPLGYAAQALADHPSYMKYTGVPDPTEFERRTWAAEDLTSWEDVVARMARPGDKAVDKERWDLPRDWEMREYLLRRLGLSDSHESTDRILRRYCDEQIGECERQLDEQPDTTAEEGE
ncbi:hypothetical protein OOK36_56040 [Streptomyces sp. NBC_00365]|uniref:hypothetical protein n=1 Tax=Streptomyces sp. NBC_00365 TaxID=2975726 RepID=UPI0022537AAD|nr:hypothetical protein [Streptomyces sp. NBC_00365]MCX5097767.1 hypothetical protein [Streptomyces sp. NBC_00365]